MNSDDAKVLKEIFSTPIPKDDEICELDEAMTSRFKCVCAYDGTDFCGWQSQPDGKSVQDFLENRLREIFKRQIRIHGSGRTDSGVHADAQVFHFDAEWRHSTSALQAALGCGHAEDIQILSVVKVSKKFHARYSVKGKRYVYRIFEGNAAPKTARYRWSLGGRKLDIDAMNSAAKLMIGTHDFTAFSANRGDGKKVNPVKELRKLKITRRGGEIKIVTEGSGYLYKMVRMLTGALVAVGVGKIGEAHIADALERRTRGNLFHAAPAKGLTLEKVFYK